MVNRMRSGQSLKSLLAVASLGLPLLAVAGGCAGGGMSIIAITPNTTQILDAGQSLPITATVINDSQAFGATFTATAGSIGQETISRTASVSVVNSTYTAPTTVASQSSATVTAISQNTPSQTASFTVTLYPALTISTTSLPNGVVNTAYKSTVLTSGGAGSLVFSVSSGTLPTGLSLAGSTGVISGTPTAFGTFTFTVSVLDASVAKVATTQSYTVTIVPQTPVITTTTLPNGLAGTAYSQQIAYTGGNNTTPSFTAVGTLPPGLTLSSTGLISGTPTVASSGATYTFTVTVTVGTQVSAPVQLAITIPAYPTVTTATLPAGNIGIAYSKQLNYNGGVGSAVTWAISPANALAGSGLTFSASGLIAGTPTTATTYNFSVTVTVGTQTSAPQSLALTINALDITSAATANGELGLPFSFQLTAAGGTPPYTWNLAAGSTPLPAGLSLNGTTGAITGTPTASGVTSGIVVQATDSATGTAGTATLAMSFNIAPARSTAGNSELTGTYAFLISGFDAGGRPLAAVGSFTANGSGVVTGGAIDINGTGLASPTSNQTLLPSTYSVGSDNRGKLTLTYGTTTLTFVTVASGISSNIATSGYLTEFDNSGNALTGIVALQTSAPYGSASVNNGFAFGLQGFAANSTPTTLVHRSAAGEIVFNGAGGSTSAEYVESASAIGGPLTPSSVNLVVASTGRGSLSINPPGGAAAQHFVVYLVSTGKFFMLSSDNASGSAPVNDLLFGQAVQQTGAGGFTTASLSGNAVVRTESLQTGATGTPVVDARLGIYSFSAGSGVVLLSADENLGGAGKTLSVTGSYSVAANGRATVSFPGGLGGCVNCVGGGNTYFYLINGNQGFVMDFTTSAVAGYFEPQTITAATASSFSGSYAVGTTLPLTRAATYLTAETTANGAGSVSGTADQNTNGTLSPDVPSSGTYVVAPSGRATFTALGSGTSVLYIVSTSKAYLLDTATGTPVIEDVIQ